MRSDKCCIVTTCRHLYELLCSLCCTVLNSTVLYSTLLHSTVLYLCSPQAARQEAVSVCEGDIILLATDGLFDNLHESAIIELCAPLVRAGVSQSQSQPPAPSPSQSAELQRELQRVADALVRRALEFSEDPAYVSPFALEARESGFDALGGAL